VFSISTARNRSPARRRSSDITPDFYTGSGHHWPCGPKEVGVLYVNKNMSGKLWPSIISAGNGPIGISKTIEGYGQRDEPAIDGAHQGGSSFRRRSAARRSRIDRVISRRR